MGIFETFSRREKERTGCPADVVRYDDLPEPFRVKVIKLWREAMGRCVQPMSMYGRMSDHRLNVYWAILVEHYWIISADCPDIISAA